MYTPSSYVVDPTKYKGKVRIYCDVDGVVNIVPNENNPHGFDSEEKITVQVQSWTGVPVEKEGTIYWNSSSIEALAEISNRTEVDFVWLTSWNEAAPRYLSPKFGIKSQGFLPWSIKFSDYNHTFKRVAIAEEQAEHPAPFIWIDDIATNKWSVEKLNTKRATKGKFLIIRTMPDMGITAEHIKQMEEFISKWS